MRSPNTSLSPRGFQCYPPALCATAIFVVVKPDAISVGADGENAATHLSIGTLSLFEAHEVYGGVLLKYGSSEDIEKTYTTDHDVQSSISSNKTFAGFLTRLAGIASLPQRSSATRVLTKP